MTFFAEAIARGLAASRPAVGDVPIGSIYYSTDTGALERNSGSAWQTIAPTSAPPSGAAGGVLSGTYPNPGFAADMATQAELDAHAALTAAHGATGAVVGTTNSQTLTNKTLTSPVVNTPTGIVKGDVGLGNVDNTSNATERAATATLAGKTLTTPTIASFVNATHDHTNAAGGGSLGGGSALTVEEVDGTPTDAAVTKLVFPNGTLAIASHVATYTPAGGGGGLTDILGHALTPPALADFPTWVNQGAATADETDGYFNLDCALDTADSWKMRCRTLPSAPYTETFFFVPTISPDTYNAWSVGWRDSATGNWRILYFDWEGSNFGFGMGANSGGGAGIATLLNTRITTTGLGIPRYWRLRDDNTTRYVEYSFDGRRWMIVFSEGRTVGITPDQVCFAIDPRNATNGASLAVLHWVEA